MSAVTSRAVAARLVDAGVAGERLLTPASGRAFRESATLWNLDVERRPALIVRCGAPADVQAAVRVAASEGIALSVRSAGHGWTGRALVDDGLAIDLREMRSVEVDADVATVSGGATQIDFVAAAERAGRTTPGGYSDAVGYAGLALGGGYGPLTSRFGLALDTILGAQIVLADGRLVNTDAGREPELFWALRGGGGNLGVVTSLRVRLHHQTPLHMASFGFPLDQAPDVLAGYAAVIASAPDELQGDGRIISSPDGTPLLILAPIWSGDPDEASTVFERIAALGDPVQREVQATTYASLLRAGSGTAPPTRSVYSTRWVPRLTPELVETLVALTRDRPSPTSGIAWIDAHGAATRVEPSATAFGQRGNHLLLMCQAQWTDGSPAPHRRWTARASEALAPHAFPGGYANFLTAADGGQAADAYADVPRLLAAKERYDPDDVFTAIPLPRHR